MARKTFEVKELIDWTNKQLQRTDEEATTDYKAGLCTSLQWVLHRTGNYEGFTFINTELGESVGVDDPRYFDRKYF